MFQMVVAGKVVSFVWFCCLRFVFYLLSGLESSNVIALYRMFPVCQVLVFSDFSNDKIVSYRQFEGFFISLFADNRRLTCSLLFLLMSIIFANYHNQTLL
ncbi:hypothetical protein GDO78_002748 [Eleutherodactylus coqui]|uniref:Uncharacterized protein n=1 Tax=Eleutherodactylus coqui TaxID=57060 RepID=A0A8J6K6T2_ELECQ|nr:hypothetical protein GDO78_002748 [Eleutherodactylus coqui]